MERAGTRIVALGTSDTSTSAAASRVVYSGGRNLLFNSDLLVSLCSRGPFNGALEVLV